MPNRVRHSVKLAEAARRLAVESYAEPVSEETAFVTSTIRDVTNRQAISYLS